MTDKPIKVAHIEGVPAPTPSQINEHAKDIGAVFIRMERRGSFEEMSIINPELMQEPAILEAVLQQIREKLIAVVIGGRK
jgi:hypothetical protein